MPPKAFLQKQLHGIFGPQKSLLKEFKIYTNVKHDKSEPFLNWKRKNTNHLTIVTLNKYLDMQYFWIDCEHRYLAFSIWLKIYLYYLAFLSQTCEQTRKKATNPSYKCIKTGLRINKKQKLKTYENKQKH